MIHFAITQLVDILSVTKMLGPFNLVVVCFCSVSQCSSGFLVGYLNYINKHTRRNINMTQRHGQDGEGIEKLPQFPLSNLHKFGVKLASKKKTNPTELVAYQLPAFPGLNQLIGSTKQGVCYRHKQPCSLWKILFKFQSSCRQNLIRLPTVYFKHSCLSHKCNAFVSAPKMCNALKTS